MTTESRRIPPTHDELIELLRRVPGAVGWAYACWDPSGGVSEVDAFLDEVEAALKALDVTPIELDQ